MVQLCMTPFQCVWILKWLFFFCNDCLFLFLQQCAPISLYLLSTCHKLCPQQPSVTVILAWLHYFAVKRFYDGSQINWRSNILSEFKVTEKSDLEINFFFSIKPKLWHRYAVWEFENLVVTMLFYRLKYVYCHDHWKSYHHITWQF